MTNEVDEDSVVKRFDLQSIETRLFNLKEASMF